MVSMRWIIAIHFVVLISVAGVVWAAQPLEYLALQEDWVVQEVTKGSTVDMQTTSKILQGESPFLNIRQIAFLKGWIRIDQGDLGVSYLPETSVQGIRIRVSK